MLIQQKTKKHNQQWNHLSETKWWKKLSKKPTIKSSWKNQTDKKGSQKTPSPKKSRTKFSKKMPQWFLSKTKWWTKPSKKRTIKSSAKIRPIKKCHKKHHRQKKIEQNCPKNAPMNSLQNKMVNKTVQKTNSKIIRQKSGRRMTFWKQKNKMFGTRGGGRPQLLSFFWWAVPEGIAAGNPDRNFSQGGNIDNRLRNSCSDSFRYSPSKEWEKLWPTPPPRGSKHFILFLFSKGLI